MVKMDDFNITVAVELYNMGLTYGEVASEFKISKPGLYLIYNKERERGVNISDKKSNIERLKHGIMRYLTEMYGNENLDEVDESIKEIFEKKKLSKIIKDVKDSISIDDIIDSKPNQKLLYAAIKYPDSATDIIDNFKKEHQKEQYNVKDLKSHIKKYLIHEFEDNYVSPALINLYDIEKAISELYFRDQIIIKMNRLFGDSYKKIGDAWGVSDSRIGQIIHRGLRNLSYSENIRKNRFPKVLCEYINTLENENEKLQKKLSKVYQDLDSDEPIEEQKLLEKSVDEIIIKHRHRNILKKMDINIIKELAEKTEEEMLRTSGVWFKTLDDFKSILAEINLRFGMTFD